MTKLTVEYGQQLIDSFKQKARKCIERRRYDDAIAYIRAAAWINYDFYIGYTDDELEYYLSHISRHVIPRRKKKKKESDGIVLIDAFSMDTQGLSAQYINAIISTGSRLLYIHRNDIGDQTIIEEYFKDVDCNLSSLYMYIKGNKLYAGPIWDFDQSMGLSLAEEYNTKSGNSTEGLYCTKNIFRKVL